MENAVESLESWVKEHRKQIMISCCVVTAATLTYVGYTRKDEIIDFFSNFIDSNKKACRSLDESIQSIEVKSGLKDVTNANGVIEYVEQKITHCPHDVSGHLRKLPEGWHPSSEKLQEAFNRHIELPEGYTLVDDYRTGDIVA